MTELREIPLSLLRLDTDNPRLDDGKQTQVHALQAMMKAQGEKLVVLGRDIAKNGLNPLDNFMVVAADDNADEFVVLEGNRRITTLKLLANPSLGDGVLSKAQVTKLQAAAAEARFTPDTEVTCVVMPSRDEAIHWLRLRHGGELGGAGVVQWGATERERFEARADKESPELQVLHLLVSQGHLTLDEANDVPITSLRRLLRDAAVRKTLGIEIDRKEKSVTSHFPGKEVLKGLRAVAHRLANPNFKVRDIYDEDNRAEFMKSFTVNELPSPKSKLGSPVNLAEAVGSVTPATKPSSSGVGSRAKHRANVAPSTPRLKIGQARLKDIYIELQHLKLEKHTNAGGVLLRVFLELTVDNYLTKHKITIKKADPKLKDKLQAVHDDMLAKGTMTKPALAPVRKAISDAGMLATSITAFNQYVHNEKLSPSPTDVRVGWDNLQEFFVSIWA